jgi:hypothetical protein
VATVFSSGAAVYMLRFVRSFCFLLLYTAFLFIIVLLHQCWEVSAAVIEFPFVFYMAGAEATQEVNPKPIGQDLLLA